VQVKRRYDTINTSIGGKKYAKKGGIV